jgi:hypothetical protein
MAYTLPPADPRQPLYLTEAEAKAEAAKLNAARKRDNVEYGYSAKAGGWQLCVYSND